MKNTIARLAGALLALTLTTSLAAAQSKITVAVGGGACLCIAVYCFAFRPSHGLRGAMSSVSAKRIAAR